LSLKERLMIEILLPVDKYSEGLTDSLMFPLLKQGGECLSAQDSCSSCVFCPGSVLYIARGSNGVLKTEQWYLFCYKGMGF